MFQNLEDLLNIEASQNKQKYSRYLFHEIIGYLLAKKNDLPN
jgi:hypothetical protein